MRLDFRPTPLLPGACPHPLVPRSYLPPETQVVLVSATLPAEVLEMTNKFMTDPIRVLVKRDELTLEVGREGGRCRGRSKGGTGPGGLAIVSKIELYFIVHQRHGRAGEQAGTKCRAGSDRLRVSHVPSVGGTDWQFL